MMDRKKPSTDRSGVTHKFKMGTGESELTVYMTANFDASGKINEIFLTATDQGSLVRTLFNVIAMMASMMLQYGIPLEQVMKQWQGQRFDPSGMVNGGKVGMFAASPLDYLAKYLISIQEKKK